MKAVFLTTHTNDVDSLVRAWDYQSREKAKHIRFRYDQPVNDPMLIELCLKAEPDLIFYIGGCAKKGIPKINTFKLLKTKAPIIHLCCDAGDQPWWPLLEQYRGRECFTLQVTLDGRVDAPVS